MWSTSSGQEGEGGGRGRRGGKEKRDEEEVEGDEYREVGHQCTNLSGPLRYQQ